MAVKTPHDSGSKKSAKSGTGVNKTIIKRKKGTTIGTINKSIKSSRKTLAHHDTEKSTEGLSRRLRKKLIVERRKRRAKRYFELGKEVGTLWEKLRQKNLPRDERSRLISSILGEVKGKIPDMVTSHITSRVLQTCVKYCSVNERAAIYEELRPHFLVLTQNTYAHHFVLKMLDRVDRAQLQQMISMLHGHVVAFLRHPVGSAVVERAYNLANSIQKQELLAEFFSPEYRLFKGIIPNGAHRLVDLLANEPATKRKSILEHMSNALHPILEKGIVDHSIVHRALVEYLSIASMAARVEIVQQLSGPLLVRMVHSKEGAKIGAMCVSTGSRKEWKKIIKGLKGSAMKMACDQYGNFVLLTIMDWVDDTELVNKFIISELAKNVKELVFNKYGRCIFLHLLSPSNTRYIQGDLMVNVQFQKKSLEQNGVKEEGREESGAACEEWNLSSKKDPFVRRTELFKASMLAEKLVHICSTEADKLLRSPIGRDLIYEVARGGSDGILWHISPDGVLEVHKAVADLGAQVCPTDKEHVFEHYFASRTIRRLIIEQTVALNGIRSPSFAFVLWNIAMKGKCRQWVEGHSKKIVSAFLLCNDTNVKKKAMPELQPLIDSGLLQVSFEPPKLRGIERKKIEKNSLDLEQETTA